MSRVVAYRPLVPGRHIFVFRDLHVRYAKVWNRVMAVSLTAIVEN